MPDDSELQQDEDAYWRSSKEFVRVLIAELNQVLKANRISTRKRRKICTSFAFSLCNFLDQQWFKPDGQIQYPLLCFAESFLEMDASPDLSKINFPHKSVELHGMVHDEIAWFFDEAQEDGTAVLTGDVGAERGEGNDVSNDPNIPLTSACPPCSGTGQCFCIRKGARNPEGCPRCGGSGQCRHCKGTGKWVHP
jgi:hypothetical protein